MARQGEFRDEKFDSLAGPVPACFNPSTARIWASVGLLDGNAVIRQKAIPEPGIRIRLTALLSGAWLKGAHERRMESSMP
jgi:hypothetical protein